MTNVPEHSPLPGLPAHDTMVPISPDVPFEPLEGAILRIGELPGQSQGFQVETDSVFFDLTSKEAKFLGLKEKDQLIVKRGLLGQIVISVHRIDEGTWWKFSPKLQRVFRKSELATSD